MLRLIRWAVQVSVIQGCVLLLMAWMLPGLHVTPDAMVFAIALLFTITQFVSWPLIYRLSATVHPLLFPLLGFGLSVGVLLGINAIITTWGGTSLRIDSFATGVLLALGLTVSYTVFAGAFSLGDASAYDWFVTRRIRQTYYNPAAPQSYGTVFIEIDGLAAPILQRALDEGWMPNLAAWQKDGSHIVNEWEPDLSSQTSASQAGILLGDNTDIPAFRWYDKPRKQLMVSSRLSTTRLLEEHLSSGKGLMLDGASRWNIFSGDAPDSILTYSTVGVRPQAMTRSYLGHASTPYMMMRSLSLFIGDIFRERWQAWQQVRSDEHPRIRRTFHYSLVRAATTTIMLELARFMLTADMYRGVNEVYCTIYAYDEVAHHSGIDRVDGFKVLQRIDTVIGQLHLQQPHTPRPYHIVVLSDHGQSMGATFRQRNGQTLGELVKSLISPDSDIAVYDSLIEDNAHLQMSIRQVMEEQPDTRTAQLLRNLVAQFSREENESREERDMDAADVRDAIVLASGNLGLISFPKFADRMTFEQISQHAPALIPGLLENRDIGFLMMRSDAEGALVIGRNGVHYLRDGMVEGKDPLEDYGPHAAAHLARTDCFINAPDILIMSAIDTTTGAVYAFEELVGSHGGLGGCQTRPFVFHSADLPFPQNPVVGAAALHDVLVSWLHTTPMEDAKQTEPAASD